MTKKKTLGIDSKNPSENHVILELIQYNDKDYGMQADIPVDELLTQFKSDHVNWINVDGLHDKSIVSKLGEHFCLHSLLVEDILSEHTPKAEEFDDHLFFTMKMLYSIKNGKIDYEQISFVLGKDFLLSFQEKEGDLFGPLRDRIKHSSGRVRTRKADYLLYRLIDVIVDNYYSVLDAVGQQIETVEDDIYKNPTDKEFQKIQKIKKELIYLRKALYPLRDALSKLTKDESGFIDQANYRYFADVYDHVVHLIDSLDTYKDLTSSLMDIHINTQNTRMNEVMKVLTVISTIFMPLTFIAGVYGMNFDNLPELHTRYGYPAVMIFMALIVFGMIRYFKYKKWF
ncbi:MAG: magnesium/cobalt transporter CorA [Cyclobacteriaceae bacterium]|nr:magnesium/cobalt transporter CorA [Cyclobacteriaceae bacterium]